MPRKSKSKAQPKKTAPEFPKVVESFAASIPDYVCHARVPSCFNGFVQVRRYRTTIEIIDEPVEILRARLQQLWDECDNHHHWTPLRNAAHGLGVTLLGNAGAKRKGAAT